MWGGGVPQRLCGSLHTGRSRGGRVGRCSSHQLCGLLRVRQGLPPPLRCTSSNTQPYSVVTGADPTCPAGPWALSTAFPVPGAGAPVPPTWKHQLLWEEPRPLGCLREGTRESSGAGGAARQPDLRLATPPRAPASALQGAPPGQVRTPTRTEPQVLECPEVGSRLPN